MASTISVIITSDLSNAPDAATVLFGWNGRSYQVDLTADEKRDFEAALQPYLGVAQIANKKSSQREPSRAVAVGLVPATVRAWAFSNGVDVPKRGRIPQDVIQRFQEAHSS
ncbi:MAG: Lsr2 family protein [Microbacteriaceae bacterium]|nr:Lsr2 family protein [Microbacteriaceae bacterium]